MTKKLFGVYLVLFLLMIAYIAYLETGCGGGDANMTWHGKECVQHLRPAHFPYYHTSRD